jgi:hypothetical protein
MRQFTPRADGLELQRVERDAISQPELEELTSNGPTEFFIGLFMARISSRNVSSASELKSWKSIAEFLGQPVATAQRWARSGMPVHRQGRLITASPDELSRWLGQQAGERMAVHVARVADTDLSADLRKGLAEARRRRKHLKAA